MQRRSCHSLAACPIPSLRWRKPDSNHRSRVTRPVFNVASVWFAANQRREREPAQKASGASLRNRWFESGSLQRRVSNFRFLYDRSELRQSRFRRGDAPVVSSSPRQYAGDPALERGNRAPGRNLVYTGVTRGKRLVVLVGQWKALAIAVKGGRARRRWSKLREWLIGSDTPSAKQVGS